MIFAIITMLTTLLVPMFLIPIIQAADPSDWYMTVDGVLDTDYYTLYPYEDNSLNVGFSKFGELIGINPMDDQSVPANWVGLEYDGRDPFCPLDVIPMTSWINGWYIDIEYTDPALSGAKMDRHLWAFALFADGFGWGGDWKWAETPGDELGYGRKTNGDCTSEALKILYDGPRRLVAMSVTHISDKEGAVMWPVADLTITMIFNKVKKEIILLKDVKLMIPKMHLWGKLNVELSNREEYDLGPSPGYDSYAHFYEQEGETCHGPEWHLADDLLREYIQYEAGNGVQTVFTLERPEVLAQDFMKIWVDGVFQDPADYTVDWDAKTVTFNVAPPLVNGENSVIEFHYKFIKKTACDWDHEYDIAQVISSDLKYVAWTAMWPPVSDFTVDGILRYLDPLIMVNEADCITSEPKQSPLIIGEWDFLLDDNVIPQFRCVEVKGVTDLHDADDADIGVGHENIIDREVQFQLDEVFQPFDLNDAVHKTTKRWVEFKPFGPTSWTLTRATPVVIVADEEWDQYSTFSEKVINLDKDELLHRRSNDPVAGGRKDYNIVLNPDGTATLTGLPKAECKILYSTREMEGVEGLIQLGLCLDGSGSIIPADWTLIKNGVAEAIINSLPHDSSVELTVVQFGFNTPLDSQIEVAPTVIDSDATANAIATTILAMAQGGDLTPMAHGLNLTWSAMKNSPNFDPSQKQIINVATDGLPNILLPVSPTGDGSDDVTWVRDWAYLEGLDEIDAEAIGAGPNVMWMRDGLVLPQPGTIAPPFDPGWVEYVPDAAAFAAAIATKFEIILPWRGRYEWIVVGKDAATVDSIGAAYMTEAFDSIKDIEVQVAGLDIRDTLYGVNVPFVMAGATTGTRTDYYYSYPCDNRSALHDDWCKTYPVSSSNMLFSGGPRANLGTEYFNEFTNAFFTAGEYVVDNIGQADKILALTCWDKNIYGSGYAVISTYKDINGTVGFLIWGMDGQDTYYATKWFWDEGIVTLQGMNRCVTDIILKITYPLFDPTHPTVWIVEQLSPISEKPQHDCEAEPIT